VLTTWDAVSTLDRMLNDVMGSTLGTATNARTFQPAVDVRSSDAELAFVCDLPGVKLEDVEVTIENGTLTLKGTRRFESKEGEQVMLGRAYGTFTRVFSLPDSVDEDRLTAILADGVLTLRVPKHAKARPRKIEIKGGPDPKHLGE